MSFKEILDKLVGYIQQIIDFLTKLRNPAEPEAPAEPDAPAKD